MVSLRVVVWRADPQYWDPQTAVDYLAVALTSATFLGLAISFGMLAINLWRIGTRVAAPALAVAAAASGLVGVANLLEDGFRLRMLFGVYPFLFLPLLIGLVV